MNRRCASLVCALALSFGGAAQAKTPEARMQALIDAFRADYGFPGMTAAIALLDGSTTSVATGLADREAATPMTTDRPTLAASIGKSFVAATVLRLEAEGALCGADLVSDNLGDLGWFARLSNHGRITFADLLRHSAGLPDQVHKETFEVRMASRVAFATGADAQPPEEANGFVLDTVPLYPSNAGWGYSDTGQLVIGPNIEGVTGRPHYDLVARRILGPLALDATAPSDSRHVPGLALADRAIDVSHGVRLEQ